MSEDPQTGSNSLVEEGFENNDLISLLDESHESAQHSFTLVSSQVLDPDHVISPSFAPVVIVTSVSGFSWRPKNGEYASARAFFRRGRPYVMVSQNRPLRWLVRTYLGRGVLIALNSIEGSLCGIQGKLRRVVATMKYRAISIFSWCGVQCHLQEALPHVYDGLDRGSSSSFIDDRPRKRSDCLSVMEPRKSYTKHPVADLRLSAQGGTGLNEPWSPTSL